MLSKLSPKPAHYKSYCSVFPSLYLSLHRSTYYLRATSDAQCSAIIDSIASNVRIAQEAAEKRSRLRRMQGSVLAAYESTAVQSVVALLIIAVHNITEKKQPEGGWGWARLLD
jgi:hypothetical protein